MWEALKLPDTTSYSEDMMAYLGKTEHIHVNRAMTNIHLILLIMGVGLSAVAISLLICRVGGCSQQSCKMLPESHKQSREDQKEGESSDSDNNPRTVLYEEGNVSISNTPQSRVVPHTCHQRARHGRRRIN